MKKTIISVTVNNPNISSSRTHYKGSEIAIYDKDGSCDYKKIKEISFDNQNNLVISTELIDVCFNMANVISWQSEIKTM